MNKLILPFCFFLILNSCDSTSEDGVNGIVRIPDIGIDCLTSIAPQCQASNAGKPLFIGMTSDLSVTCRTLFDSVNISTLTPSFEASGFGVTTFRSSSPPAVTGEVVTWRNQLTNSVEFLADQNYKFCAVIDVNNDNLLSPGEPYMDQTNFLSDLTQLTLDSWNTF